MEQTFIITGGNSGLGFQTAKNIALESPENHIIIASRNKEKSDIAVKTLVAETGNANIQVITLDLSSLLSIRNFVEYFYLRSFPPLFGIVCNAISGGGDLTKDGFDMTFGTGHLGHFLLVNLLLKNMQNGRIIFVSSDQHNPPAFIAKLQYTDAIDFAYPNKKNHSTRYSFTKLCNIYCAYSFAEKLNPRNITVNAFNPGFMADTGLAKPKNVAEKTLQKIAPLIAQLLKTKSSAKISGKLLANYLLNPEYKDITGKYFDRDKEAQSSKLSYNQANANNLWQRSVELVKLTQEESILI